MNKKQFLSSIILKVSLSHETRDMSIFNRYTQTKEIPLEVLQKSDKITDPVPECGTIYILSVSPSHIAVRWLGEEFALSIGEQANSKQYRVDNPYLSFDGIQLSLEYINTSKA